MVILRVWQRNAKRNTKLFHNNTKKYMAQRFKELNKNATRFGLIHKIDGSFNSSIESNGLVAIQESTYTKSFELS